MAAEPKAAPLFGEVTVRVLPKEENLLAMGLADVEESEGGKVGAGRLKLDIVFG